MSVKIEDTLSKETYLAWREAQKKASELHTAHQKAENEAFMALMAEIGVVIGSKVTITQERWSGGIVGNAILTGPKSFNKIKKDGTASTFEFHKYGPYTVEKFTSEPE